MLAKAHVAMHINQQIKTPFEFHILTRFSSLQKLW